MTYRTEHLADGVTLQLADCREVIPTLPAVDVVITDPPYGAATHTGARSAKSLDRSTIDFAPVTATELAGLAQAFCTLANRWVVMTCDWQHAAALAASARRLSGLASGSNPTPRRNSAATGPVWAGKR